ncbi:MAG: chorismate mutase [Elusimicrobiales bacterium]|nr:chorismate mutase [Elusimicrobiales bacterium]
MMTDKLAAARAKIDALDRKISALLSRRFALAQPLAALKSRVKDPAREKAVLKNAEKSGEKRFSPATRGVFAEIIRQSTLLQGKK